MSFYLEEELQKYRDLLATSKSSRKAILYLVNFYKELFNQDNEAFIQVYIAETIDQFDSHLKLYSAYGIKPSLTEEIVFICEKLLDKNLTMHYKGSIEDNLSRLKTELDYLNKSLNGEAYSLQEVNKISFPVVEKLSKFEDSFGLIESLKISINKNKKTLNDEFFIIPRLPQLEEKLESQIKISWEYAKKFVGPNYSHKSVPLEITINFENKFGIYEGDSLGAALSIGFIQELFGFYELRDTLNFSENIISTGAINSKGEIAEVGKNIVEKKTLTAFYSLAKIFVIPFNDLSYAENVLSKEKAKFPKRELELIPVKNIKEIIYRRDVVDIKKQNIVKWGTKKLYKNKITLFSILVLIAVVTTFYLISIDKNPFYIDYTNDSFLVKNKYDEVLWELKTNTGLDSYGSGYLSNYYKILDYDDDGTNEILFSESEFNGLSLYDNKGNIIWNYKYSNDSLKTDHEIFSNKFADYKIIDTTTLNGRKTIICFFQQVPYYPTAIVKIDLETGNQFGDIFWHSGGITNGKLLDYDNDGKLEIMCIALNNGWRRGVYFCIELEKLSGQSPPIKKYTFDNLEVTDFDSYILLPTPDYFRYDNPKYFSPNGLNIYSSSGEISIGMIRTGLKRSDGVQVITVIDMNSKPLKIILHDKYIVERDKLVRNGILNYPLTDTEEYKEILMKQIEYWDGEKFVKFFP